MLFTSGREKVLQIRRPRIDMAEILFTGTLTHALTRAFTHSFNHDISQLSVTHSLTHSLTQSPIQPSSHPPIFYLRQFSSSLLSPQSFVRSQSLVLLIHLPEHWNIPEIIHQLITGKQTILQQQICSHKILRV